MSLVQTPYFITRKPALKTCPNEPALICTCSGYLQGISRLRTALRSKIKDPLFAAEKKSLVTRPRARTRPSKSGCKLSKSRCSLKSKNPLVADENHVARQRSTAKKTGSSFRRYASRFLVLRPGIRHAELVSASRS